MEVRTLLKTHGRIAISGILGHSIAPSGKRETWRISFILGMMTAGVLVVSVAPELIQVANGRNLLWFGIGGFLVGLGSRMMNGCTSGHGICGVSRLSKRSLSAVITFMVIGAITVHFTKYSVDNESKSIGRLRWPDVWMRACNFRNGRWQ